MDYYEQQRRDMLRRQEADRIDTQRLARQTSGAIIGIALIPWALIAILAYHVVTRSKRRR